MQSWLGYAALRYLLRLRYLRREARQLRRRRRRQHQHDTGSHQDAQGVAQGGAVDAPLLQSEQRLVRGVGAREVPQRSMTGPCGVQVVQMGAGVGYCCCCCCCLSSRAEPPAQQPPLPLLRYRYPLIEPRASTELTEQGQESCHRPTIRCKRRLPQRKTEATQRKVTVRTVLLQQLCNPDFASGSTCDT